MGWNQSFTIVAGADLSAAQYKCVNPDGVLTSSATNVFAGVLQGKPQAGEHATVCRLGVTRIYAAASIGAGSYIGLSGTTSGGVAPVGSGGFAIGFSIDAISSGYTGRAQIFGGLAYVAK